MVDGRPVPAAPAGDLDQVPGAEVLQPEVVAWRELGHRPCHKSSLFVLLCRMMNGRQDFDAARRRAFPVTCPLFASGRKSTMRLCPVAAAIGCSVRILAGVRPRSSERYCPDR